jgi:hypothetical protein
MTKYPATGPFTTGVTPITAAFLNNLETYLGYAADSNVSADGSGNITARSIHLNRGSLFEIGFFSGVGTVGSVAHGCSAKPNIIVVVYHPASDTTFGGEPSVIPHAENIGNTNTGIRAQTSYNWRAIAIRF